MSSEIPGFPEWSSSAPTAVIMTQLANPGTKKPEQADHNKTRKQDAGGLISHPHLIHYLPWHPTPVMTLLDPPSYLFNSVVLQMCSEDACMLSHFSCIWLCNPMDCSPPGSRQEYWSGLLCPPPGDLPNPRIEPTSLMSPALQAGSLPLMQPDLHQNQLRCLFQDFLNLLGCSPRMCFLNRLCEGILLCVQVWEWLSLT